MLRGALAKAVRNPYLDVFQRGPGFRTYFIENLKGKSSQFNNFFLTSRLPPVSHLRAGRLRRPQRVPRPCPTGIGPATSGEGGTFMICRLRLRSCGTLSGLGVRPWWSTRSGGERSRQASHGGRPRLPEGPPELEQMGAVTIAASRRASIYRRLACRCHGNLQRFYGARARRRENRFICIFEQRYNYNARWF